MSQHWHGHWTEDAFTPKRLRNWKVPKWYPSWPDRHCVTTEFVADDNGHVLDNVKRVEHSPWGTFKVCINQYYTCSKVVSKLFKTNVIIIKYF